MSAEGRPVITGAVEGDLDEAILRRIVSHSGLLLGTVHGRKGKPYLLKSVGGFNQAAQFAPWVVVVDLNGDFGCAPESMRNWLPEPSAQMCFRVAVRAVEAWILADRERIAEWLGVSIARVPADPDALANPKRGLVDLARHSRRSIRGDLVPRDGSGRTVGALYTTRVMEFVQDGENGWRPASAIDRSESLARCVTQLRERFER